MMNDSQEPTQELKNSQTQALTNLKTINSQLSTLSLLHYSFYPSEPPHIIRVTLIPVSLPLERHIPVSRLAIAIHEQPLHRPLQRIPHIIHHRSTQKPPHTDATQQHQPRQHQQAHHRQLTPLTAMNTLMPTHPSAHLRLPILRKHHPKQHYRRITAPKQPLRQPTLIKPYSPHKTNFEF